MTRVLFFSLCITLIYFEIKAQRNTRTFEVGLPTKEELTERYLKKGAWRYRLFAPEWQLYLDSAIRLNPNIAYFYQQKAMPYFKQGKYEIAMPMLNKAVILDEAAYIDYRGFMKCIFTKQYELAIQDFERAIVVKGSGGYIMDHSYEFYIGLSKIQLNKFHDAIAYLQKSIDKVLITNGEKWVHALDYFYLGIAYQELQQHEAAILSFDQALKNYQNFSDAEYYKAISLSRTGKYDEAKKILTVCEQHFKMGYTINEDNAIYERYPYQISKFHINLIKGK